ncbi:DUF397 domain-containing protein [Streptomyces sp. NPDC051576]|uniref:DUF397 domain-containing protein n=1 Tax=Streptomyces sp. NPDC051576 TaxID=3155803 RepID=UPI00343284B5
MKRSKGIDLHSVTWRKSSYSNGEGADCVEIAAGVPGLIPVRDSKRPHTADPVLLFPTAAWSAFLTDVKR